MTDADLRRLALAATPGPWLLLKGDDEFLSAVQRQREGGFSVAGLTPKQGRADAAYIAAANPAAMVALLDRLAAAEKNAARYQHLRQASEGAWWHYGHYTADAMDAAIDAAMRGLADKGAGNGKS